MARCGCCRRWLARASMSSRAVGAPRATQLAALSTSSSAVTARSQCPSTCAGRRPRASSRPVPPTLLTARGSNICAPCPGRDGGPEATGVTGRGEIGRGVTKRKYVCETASFLFPEQPSRCCRCCFCIKPYSAEYCMRETTDHAESFLRPVVTLVRLCRSIRRAL